MNTGNRNTGDWNTGIWNTGNRNTGNWNTGNWNTGYFNIDEPKVRIFWKETDVKRENITFPGFCCFNPTGWICESDMTEEQKNNPNNDYYKTTGWILVKYDYKEAFRKSYYSLSPEEKEKQTKQLRELPNFDADIFKQISWIDINKETKKKIIIDWKEREISNESYEALKKSLECNK